ncbi:hypothetical protein E0E53_18975 [Azotobacter chroococcum]|nr:hypothetical protein E0E53_18975 [Azotobacter chroococcum]
MAEFTNDAGLSRFFTTAAAPCLQFLKIDLPRRERRSGKVERGEEAEFAEANEHSEPLSNAAWPSAAASNRFFSRRGSWAPPW